MRRSSGQFCGWMTDTLEERFWSRVEKTDGCWLWTWGKDADGYGLLRYKYVNHRTHRLSWVLANGQSIPDGMVVRHSCDNPPCVNPAHLSIGTVRDNTADMVAKCRHATYGERNPKAILLPHQVLEIRELLGSLHNSQIAAQYGVSTCTVNDIEKRRSWRHL